ncbi:MULTISPECIES: hypothetical protein [unclassified Streptomyces]
MCEIAADATHASSATVMTPGEPSGDLLDRALVGWERFISSFEESSDG